MSEIEVPEDHPRYQSLLTRHRIEEGVEKGITSRQGLIAEGRGEAFDYLLGEKTIKSADTAARVAAAQLLLAEKPVISVNGNVAALVANEAVELAEVVDAAIEINLFNRTETRMQAIADYLHEHGATDVKGLAADARIPNLSHDRAKVDSDGIAAADVVVVPLEDGDRAEALGEMNKTEIVIDLNPLSRSAQVADIPIIDNIIRAVPNINTHAKELDNKSNKHLTKIVNNFNSQSGLTQAEKTIRNGISQEN